MTDSGQGPVDSRRRSSKQSVKSTSSSSSHTRPKSDSARNVSTKHQPSSSSSSQKPQSPSLAARPGLQDRTYSEPTKRRPDRRVPSTSKLNVSPTQSETFLFRSSIDQSHTEPASPKTPVGPQHGSRGLAIHHSGQGSSGNLSPAIRHNDGTETLNEHSANSKGSDVRSIPAVSSFADADLAGDGPSQYNAPIATVASQASEDMIVEELVPGLKTPRPNTDASTETFRRNSLLVPSLSGKRSPHSFLNLDDSPRPSFGHRFDDDQTLDNGAAGFQSLLDNKSLSAETGLTFHQLIAKLLSPTSSEQHSKFVTTFLTLYRFFATPSQLLDAITNHFDANNSNEITPWVQEPTLDRDLHILDQWINAFPGDFAKITTRRKLRSFCAKVAEEHRVVEEEPLGGVPEFSEAPTLAKTIGGAARLAQSASQIAFVLDHAEEDDDTEWGFSDDGVIKRGRTNTFLSVSSVDSQSSTEAGDKPLSKISTTNPVYDMELIFGGQSTLTLNAMGSTRPNKASNTSTSSPTLLNVAESAQRQAADLHPTSTYSFNKTIWRGFLALPDEQIAREITRMDWIMFSAIRPRDLVRQVTLPASERKDYGSLEHITRMTDHFNHVAYWATNMILFRDKAKHRAQALEKFMRLGRKLRELNNYNGLGAVIAGVQGTAVFRLNATKELVNQNVSRDFMKLEILMAATRGHWAYRLAWENTSTERIPFLPLHRRDLLVTDAGGKTFVNRPPKPPDPPPSLEPLQISSQSKTSSSTSSKAHSHSRSKSRTTPSSHAKPNTKHSPSLAAVLKESSKRHAAASSTASESEPSHDDPPLINWTKFSLMGDVLSTLQAAQLTPYPAFTQNDEIRAIILDHALEKDEDKLYERSVALEAGAAGLGAAAGAGAASVAGGGGVGGGAASGGTVVSAFQDPAVRKRVMDKIGQLVG